MQIKQIIGCIAILATGQIYASSLERSESVEQTIIKEAQVSQKKVTTSAEHALELQAEIEALQAEIDDLSVYHDHLGKLIDSQNRELSALEVQLDEISQTRQSVVPLMYRMLDGLEHYIRQDMPIRKAVRVERVNALRELMVQADVAEAEKYRRILEAYQVEMDYINKLGIYNGPIEIDGVMRETEQLNLGHVSLVARSPDKQQYWLWNTKQQTWQSLDDKLTDEIAKAFLVANKLAPPALLLLPLSEPEVSQ